MDKKLRETTNLGVEVMPTKALHLKDLKYSQGL